MIPGAKAIRKKLLFRSEFKYDKSFFKNNYSHSSSTSRKTGYNMLLIAHSLEKGMSNQKPRRFGVEKTADLMSLIKKYELEGGDRESFEYVNAVNTLRSYANFYKENNWEHCGELDKVEAFLRDYKNTPKMNAGRTTIKKSDFEKDASIDYKKFLASRHSVREYSPKIVSEKDIRAAIDAAILSPSACNRQMCKAYYIVDPEKRKKIIAMGQGFSGFNKSTINPIVITFDVNANYFIGERNQGWLNAGLFSMNLVNALHSRGIGSCFCQFGNTTTDERKIKSMLNIPDSERIAVIISCGYYCDESIITHSPRRKVNDTYRRV